VIRLDYVPYMKEILLQKLLAGDEVRGVFSCVRIEPVPRLMMRERVACDACSTLRR